MRIYKYGRDDLVPVGAKVIAQGYQHGIPFIWCEVKKEEKRVYPIIIMMTGEDPARFCHLATFVTDTYVEHWYLP